jgi:LacI family transcriptional regulator
MVAMTKTRQIALAFPITQGHHADRARGILDYARQHGDWTFVGGPENVALSMQRLRGWPGDGVIADLVTRREANAAGELGLPVVNVSGALADAGFPRVTNDNAQLGRLAAEELLRCEIRRFAYYGLKGVWYSQERCRGFAERIAEDGHACTVLRTASTLESRATWYGWLEELQQWLKRVQPPLGLMAVNDHRARMAVHACRQVGLHVPHDVAIVGVDNDQVACEASQPTLSSVACAGWEIGFRSAELLDQLMSRKRPPQGDVLVPASGVVPRQSTDMVAVDDPKLGAAVRFIRERLAEPFNVDDVLRHIDASRRWLEYRFRERFGHSPHEYICAARVERAKQLLTRTPKLRLSHVAEACGFTDTRNLRLVFRRSTGVTPAEFQRAETRVPSVASVPDRSAWSRGG